MRLTNRAAVIACLVATLAATGCGKDVAEVSAADTEAYGSIEEVVAAVREAGVACAPEPIVGQDGKKISGVKGMALEGWATCGGLTIESIFHPGVIVGGKKLSVEEMRDFFTGKEAEKQFRDQAIETFNYITDNNEQVSDYGTCLLLGRNWVIRMSYDPDSDEDGAVVDKLATGLRPYVECNGARPPKGW
jgi:hypothetical protein